MSDDHDFDGFERRRNQYDLNSKIMLTAIVSLSVVVVLVTILHIYARCILRRHARRRAAFRHITVAQNGHLRTTEPPKAGLDQAVIDSLPIFEFKKIDSSDEMGSIECSVCLSQLEDGEMARTLPNCKHIFHVDCIDKWFQSQSTCPICRAEAEPRLLVPEPREGMAGVPATAPPLESVTSALTVNMEGTSTSGVQNSAKIMNGSSSSSRLSSFRRILSRERSSRRIPFFGPDHDGIEDLERQ